MGRSGDVNLAEYLGEQKPRKLLTSEEECSLSRRARRGDTEARDHMIMANVRLVFSTARRYSHLGFPFEDLIQEGMIGLMKAVEKFDPDAGCRFSTYSMWWIRQRMQRMVGEQHGQVRVPSYIIEVLSRFRKVRAAMIRAGELEPTTAEVVNRMGLGANFAARIDSALKTKNLAPVSERDKVPAKQRDQADVVADRLDARDLLEILADDRLQEIVVGRIMQGETLKSLGEKLNLSRERIRQLERDALDIMKGSCDG